MGSVKIETINRDKKFMMEIESDNLYAINCLSGKTVEFLDRIREICIAEEIILIRTEDQDFRNGSQNAPFVKDNREENNVNAFDWQGNHLWNLWCSGDNVRTTSIIMGVCLWQNGYCVLFLYLHFAVAVVP